MIIKPKIRGFICITAHPEGCAHQVAEQIALVRSRGPVKDGPRKVLVIGASTGYGLSSRIVSAFGCGAATVGVFFEKPAEDGRCASPGWYNSAAFEKETYLSGLYAKSINGDAFSKDVKDRTVALIKRDLGQVDLVVYSLASPRRTHPVTGEVFKSVLKPVGAPFTAKNLNTDKKLVDNVTIEPASDEDQRQTVGVMGGEDWEMWMDALEQGGVLAEGATTVAYSYIGPEVTWPIYKNGTIGRAKNDLDRAAAVIDARLKVFRGRAFVSVNKAVVTQASSAIPVVPLYNSILFKVMKAKGLHEGCIEQIQRLFATQMYGNGFLQFDENGRVRVDDWEMRADVQAEVAAIWQKVETANLDEVSDFSGYQSDFLKLFGFGIPGINYEADINPEVPIDLA